VGVVEVSGGVAGGVDDAVEPAGEPLRIAVSQLVEQCGPGGDQKKPLIG